MGRTVLCHLRLHASAAAVCLFSLFGTPAAHAAMVFDVGSGGPDASAVVPAHVPTWVQVVAPNAALYVSDSGDDLAAARLTGFAFLRVLSHGAARLQVDMYDDSGNPVLRGWIEADQVLPSTAGTDWLVSARPTTLWSTADGGAHRVRNLERFTPLQQIDGLLQNRIQVRVYRPDFSAMVDQGWIDQSDTGPALAPGAWVPSPTDRPVGLRSLGSTSQQQDFLDAAAQAAREGAARTGVPASVTVAQAILESDWGRSVLAQDANNYFGMKAMGTLGNAGVVWLPTSEYDDDGQVYETVSAFRAYKSLTDSITDHDRLLQTASRYAPAMRVANDPRLFATRLADAGYATDPAYADKLVALMDRYNLYQLDA